MSVHVDYLPDLVKVACAVTARGWPVLAIRHGTKQPVHGGSVLPNHGDHWLRSPQQVVAAWENAGDPWTGTVGCQFAALTGQPNPEGLCLVALDADVDGDWTRLDDLLAQAGPDAIEWAATTLRAEHSPDRAHLWGVVRAPSPTTGKLAAGIEWRGAGGYVLLIGALHPSGSRYAMTQAAEPLPVPPSLLAIAAPPPTTAQVAEPSRVVEPVAVAERGGAFDRVLAALGSRVAHRRSDGSVQAHCPGPTHRDDDQRPSLSVRDGGDRVLLKCFVGCPTEDVVATLGLTMADLFDAPGVVVEVEAARVDHMEVEGLWVPATAFKTRLVDRLLFRLADRAAQDEIEAAEVANAPDKWLAGDVVLDTPVVSPIWGPSGSPYTASGQSTLLAGPDGTGKSTICCHYAKARLGLPGWGETMLGEPVEALRADQAVLYIAADRPVQIFEGFGRGMTEAMREVLHERLAFWPGPPPMDLATRAGQQWLLRKVQQVNAGLVFFDSRKDVGDVMDPREVTRLNRLLKHLDADGVEVFIPHHNIQTADKLSKPPELTQVKGLREVFSGMGSVLMIKGAPGSEFVTLHQVKPVRELHPPVRLRIDMAGGRVLAAPLAAFGTKPGEAVLDLSVAGSAPTEAEQRRDRLRAVFTEHADPQGWAPAKALLQALGAARLDREFAGLTAKEGGPIESNKARAGQSAYRWVDQ